MMLMNSWLLPGWSHGRRTNMANRGGACRGREENGTQETHQEGPQGHLGVPGSVDRWEWRWCGNLHSCCFYKFFKWMLPALLWHCFVWVYKVSPCAVQPTLAGAYQYLHPFIRFSGKLVNRLSSSIFPPSYDLNLYIRECQDATSIKFHHCLWYLLSLEILCCQIFSLFSLTLG